MKIGVLSQYFKGIAAKRLVKGEVSPKVSNQHEFNGVNSLGLLLGYHADKNKKFPAKFIYLNDNLENPVEFDSTVTWYDTRRNQAHRAPEYRLYYQTSSVMEYAAFNDLLIVAKTQTDELLIIIAAAGSTFDNQLRYLFGLDLRKSGYEIFEEQEIEKIQLGYTQKIILSSIGIEIEETDENILEIMLDKFTGTFPTTKIFSEFARSTINDLDPLTDPDLTIILWMEKEEILFKTLERYFIATKLKEGFGNENNLVDEFLKYSLSIHNRRKSRVGFALENHLEEIFRLFNIKYARTVVTENKSKPDFLFPGVNEYHSLEFPVNLLTILGVKSTCKDRWRQVLSEAEKIEKKHLLTLEPGISENQTLEMASKNLTLVIPKSIHSTYKETQKNSLISLMEFIEIVRSKQRICSNNIN